MLEERLGKLSGIYGPFGREDRVAAEIAKIAGPWADSVFEDALVNLIALRKGTGGRKVMLSADMGIAGLVAVDILADGRIKASPVGADKGCYAGAAVVFAEGALGRTPEDGPQDDGFIYIDIGAKNREDAMRSVSIGDIAMMHGELTVEGGEAACPGIAGRMCCAAALDVLCCPAGQDSLYVVFAAMSNGEGCIEAALNRIQPDWWIHLGTVGAAEQPGKGAAAGCGPVVELPFKPAFYMAADYGLDKCAGALEIPLQHVEMARRSSVERFGYANSRRICLPVQGMNTPRERCSAGDARHAVRLIKAMIM